MGIKDKIGKKIEEKKQELANIPIAFNKIGNWLNEVADAIEAGEAGEKQAAQLERVADLFSRFGNLRKLVPLRAFPGFAKIAPNFRKAGEKVLRVRQNILNGSAGKDDVVALREEAEGCLELLPAVASFPTAPEKYLRKLLGGKKEPKS